MNRRHFFTALAKATAGFTILPAATTYARRWAAPNDGWVKVGRIYTPPGEAVAMAMGMESPCLGGYIHSWEAMRATFFQAYVESALAHPPPPGQTRTIWSRDSHGCHAIRTTKP